MTKVKNKSETTAFKVELNQSIDKLKAEVPIEKIYGHTVRLQIETNQLKIENEKLVDLYSVELEKMREFYFNQNLLELGQMEIRIKSLYENEYRDKLELQKFSYQQSVARLTQQLKAIQTDFEQRIIQHTESANNINAENLALCFEVTKPENIYTNIERIAKKEILTLAEPLVIDAFAAGEINKIQQDKERSKVGGASAKGKKKRPSKGDPPPILKAKVLEQMQVARKAGYKLKELLINNWLTSPPYGFEMKHLNTLSIYDETQRFIFESSESYLVNGTSIEYLSHSWSYESLKQMWRKSKN